MEYKSVTKYLSKKNKNKKNGKHNYLYSFISKMAICIILILGTLVFLKYDKNNKQIVYKYLYENNISFATINNWYKKHFGDITPFEDIVKDNTKLVFNDNLEYQEANIYKDGVKLKVDKNYLVPVLESGIVVFIGDKEGYGKTIIIEQTDGVNTWYGNVDNINVSLYDYVSKGEFLAEANEKLYMVFQKSGKYLKYTDYLK